MKEDHQALQDLYTNNSQLVELKKKHNKELQQMKQRRLQSVFRKRKLKLILAIEYILNKTIISTTTQVEIEKAVIKMPPDFLQHIHCLSSQRELSNNQA